MKHDYLEQFLSQWQGVFETAQDAVVNLALDGTIMTWNTRATRLYGHSPVEAIGSPVSILVPPDQEQEVHRLLRRLVTSREPVNGYTSEHRRKDGSPLRVSLSLIPLQAVHGHVIGVSMIAREIVDHTSKSDHAVQQTSGEQEYLPQLPDLIRQIAQECRTPLATLLLSLYLIKKSDNLHHHQHHLDIIEQQSHRLVELVNKLTAAMEDTTTEEMPKVEVGTSNGKQR